MNNLTDEQRQELFSDNQKLVRFFVNKVRGLHDTKEDIEDMEQIAALSLWQACCFYEPERNTSFSKFAIAKMRWDWINSHKSVSDRKIIELSLSTEVIELKDESITIADQLSDTAEEQRIDDVAYLTQFRAWYEKLDMRQQKIVSLCANGYTRTEIGQILGISKQRVCQILQSIYKKMKKD